MPYTAMTRYLLLVICLFSLFACSTSKIKTLTMVEKAQQLLADQKTNQFDEKAIPIKINYVVPEKVVVGKQLDIGIELASAVALPELILTFNTSDGMVFRKSWLVFKQKTVTRTLKNLKADKLYHQTISVIPKKEGLLHLDVYTIYPEGSDKRAKKLTITFSTGDSLTQSKSRPADS